jgi:CubicO group peptidase (beta-lactamase class C family)
MRALHKGAPHGSVWNYNSGEINLVGAVVERATGQSLAGYLSHTLWSRLGMEHDATWWKESHNGIVLGGVGLAATARDYARFGLFVANDGVLDGQRLLPPGWFDEAGSSHTIGGTPVDYGYLWWPLSSSGDNIHESAFAAQGIFGQRLYINRREKLVIVVLSARSKPTGATVIDDNAFFAAVAHALH